MRELLRRIALGATTADVRWLVIRRAMWQIAIELGVGILATYGWDRIFGLDRWSDPLASRQWPADSHLWRSLHVSSRPAAPRALIPSWHCAPTDAPLFCPRCLRAQEAQ